MKYKIHGKPCMATLDPRFPSTRIAPREPQNAEILIQTTIPAGGYFWPNSAIDNISQY
jgi:hypothetical protein